jgi:hypothetical protein
MTPLGAPLPDRVATARTAARHLLASGRVAGAFAATGFAGLVAIAWAYEAWVAVPIYGAIALGAAIVAARR